MTTHADITRVQAVTDALDRGDPAALAPGRLGDSLRAVGDADVAEIEDNTPEVIAADHGLSRDFERFFAGTVDEMREQAVALATEQAERRPNRPKREVVLREHIADLAADLYAGRDNPRRTNPQDGTPSKPYVSNPRWRHPDSWM